MNLLLDTHIWLWTVAQPRRLSRPVHRQLRKSAGNIWLSPISLWEVQSLGRGSGLGFTGDIREWIAQTLASFPIREAPLTFDVAADMANFELPHRDPADRFIVATARVNDLTLVTADTRIIKARACHVLPND